MYKRSAPPAPGQSINMHVAGGLIRQAGDPGLSRLLHCHFPILGASFLPKDSRLGMMEEIQLSMALLGEESIFIFIRLKYIFLNYFPLMIIK